MKAIGLIYIDERGERALASIQLILQRFDDICDAVYFNQRQYTRIVSNFTHYVAEIFVDLLEHGSFGEQVFGAENRFKINPFPLYLTETCQNVID